MDDEMDVRRRDYTRDEVEAARLVLMELAELLEEYWPGIVVIGGWVPYFLIPQSTEPHEGTKDVDLVLDARRLSFEGDETIEELLTKQFFQQDERRPFRWEKSVEVNGRWMKVIVEFLAGEIEGRPVGSLQRIQDVPVSTMHGCEVAFIEPSEIQLSSSLMVRVASAPQFLVMKALALHNRDREETHDDARKDAYDIYYVVKRFPGGLDELCEKFVPHLQHPVFIEGLQKLAAKWQSRQDRGPTLVAERAEGEFARFLRRDAFEQISAMLRRLGY